MSTLHLLVDGFFDLDKSVFLPEMASGLYAAAAKSLLIVTPKEKILVDTGVGNIPQGRKFDKIRRVMNVHRSKGAGIEKELRKHGIRPREITAVVNTHLHGAHTGNNNLFTDAKFYVAREEFRFMDRLAAEDPNQTAYIMEYFDHVKDFVEVKGEHRLTDEVTVVPTPGHTLGHQSVVIEKEAGTLVYSGDVSPLRENLENQVPMSGCDRGLALESMRKLLRIENARWIFSHDSSQLSLRKAYAPS